MKQFLEAIVSALVDHPEHVDIQEIEASRTSVYELRVGEGDLGKVIGKGGQTAKALGRCWLRPPPGKASGLSWKF